MTARSNKNYQRLLHIKEARLKIKHYIKGVSREDFLANKQIQDAVLYNLIIIGEAVINVDTELLNKYPYPCFKVRQLRNYAAHEYFSIQLWTIWGVANEHVDTLLNIINTILKDNFQSG